MDVLICFKLVLLPLPQGNYTMIKYCLLIFSFFFSFRLTVLNLLHAHSISLFAHSCIPLNLFAIRIALRFIRPQIRDDVEDSLNINPTAIFILPTILLNLIKGLFVAAYITICRLNVLR